MTRHTPNTQQPTPAGVYPRAWAVWAVATAVSFAALEAAALATRAENGTLSAQLRRRRRASAALVAVGAAWLVHHIAWADATPPAAPGVDGDTDGLTRDWSWR